MSKRPAITTANTNVTAGGRRVWRSLEERADPSRVSQAAASEPEVALDESSERLVQLGRAKAEQPGPAEASRARTRSGNKEGVGRRAFLALSGTAAAASLTGCLRRPVENILPYTRQPEYVVPGIPLHYATTLPRRGDVIGVLVESHEGRPTKIEGNPEHPTSRPGPVPPGEVVSGGADLFTQAAILNLYDQDRSAHVMRRQNDALTESSWADFDEVFADHLRGLEANAGEGLRFLVRPTTSPTELAAREALLRRFPQARIVVSTPLTDWNALEGARVAFAQPYRQHVDYSRARVILSLDNDFLLTESGNARWQAFFANGRRFTNPEDARDMNRLYVVESVVSVTGANADHRLRLPSRDIGRYLLRLAAALRSAGVNVAGESIEENLAVPDAWLGPVAADLARNRQRSAVVVGSRQPPWVHALANAINHALDNVAQTITYFQPLETGEAEPVQALRTLVEDMRAQRVNTLVMIGQNPVYDAPHDLDFATALSAVATKIHMGPYADETARACDWHLPMAHELECWADHRSLEGVYSIQQPLISPLRGGRNAIELIGFASGERSWRAYHAVQRTFAAMAPAAVREEAWRVALQRGLVAGTRGATPPGGIDPAALTTAIAAGRSERAALSRENFEVTFVPCNKLLDWQWGNNPWLLELPDPITKVSWDNPAMISWGTAQELQVRNGKVIRIEREGGEAIEVPVVVVPGMADHTIALSMGWGRRAAGRHGTGQGFDVFPARTTESLFFADGYRVAVTGRTYPLSLTQEHHAMDGRPLAVDATVQQYAERPEFGQWATPTPAEGPLWTEVDYHSPHPPARGGLSWQLMPENRQPEPGAPPRHAWGMVIDLTTCTGCNACVIACIAENNTPTVGKQQVARGREMHWLRIDRYFTEAPMPPWEGPDHAYEVVNENALEVAFQPVACVHCEEAPCENVCPVNATAHSPEGINEMAYNRCIGTRYCMNNCPYKVRRFNYLAFQAQVPELRRMQFNPNVSVRMRGVVEKCTYCVQRVQSARIHARNEGRRIRDGEVVPACAQTCPSRAIVFGDINDPDSHIHRMYRVDRQYGLLSDVGTQPRTRYLGRIRNPNPEMV